MKTRIKLLSFFSIITLIGLLFTLPSFAGSLVAYWSFDEGPGDILKDNSGTGNDGEVSKGCEWVEGVFGKAMEFSGSDSYVLVKNNDSYNFGKGDSFSISLWANYDAKGDWQGLLQKFNGGYPFKVEVNTANELYFSLWDQVNNPGAIIGDVSGDWHHCCFLRDAKNKKLYGYLDGVLKQESNDTITAEIANAVDLYIGARTPGNTITYIGLLDEIAIYNRILTEDEIGQAINGKLPETKGANVSLKHSLSTCWGDIKSKI